MGAWPVIILVHGDESPDAVNGVPTRWWASMDD